MARKLKEVMYGHATNRRKGLFHTWGICIEKIYPHGANGKVVNLSVTKAVIQDVETGNIKEVNKTDVTFLD